MNAEREDTLLNRIVAFNESQKCPSPERLDLGELLSARMTMLGPCTNGMP